MDLNASKSTRFLMTSADQRGTKNKEAYQYFLSHRKLILSSFGSLWTQPSANLASMRSHPGPV
jgi:hypothetical protein